VAKDRARPFSKKHRRYWITVTGGMLLIGAINVGIGVCVYDKGPDQVQRLDPLLKLAEIPVPVMRAFTKAHPQHVPHAAKKLDDGTYELYFMHEGERQTARYRADGTGYD
jgi:hypothetical protein